MHTIFVGLVLLYLKHYEAPRHGASSGCGWRKRPPDVDGCSKYECIE